MIFNSKFVCTLPEGKKAVNTEEKTPNDDPVRHEGLRRGDPITAVGALTGITPASLEVKHWCSGSVAEYRAPLSSNSRNSYIICPLIALAGAGMFFAGWKKT